jgi:hypothetical protein
MAHYDPSYTAKVNFDLHRMGLDNFDELPTYSLEDVIIETFPDRKRTDQRRIYPHVEWLACHIAGIEDRHAMAWTMTVWRDTLLELGYSVDMMVAVFHIWHKETVLAHPGRAAELERDRRAMEEAMEVPVPPPSPPASAASPATTGAPVVIVISDDEDDETIQGRWTGADAENESASEDWRGLILGGGGFPELPQTGEQPGPFYVCNRCSVPGKKNLPPLNYYRFFLFLTFSFLSGHFIQDCPTNLDPAYDRPPPEDYSCAYCGSKQHFITTCPRNTRPDSMNQQRIRAGIIPPLDDRDLHSTVKVVEMAKKTTKHVSRGAGVAPSLVDTNEDRPIEGSRDQLQSGLVCRRTASPHGRDGKHRSRSPLRDRGNEPKPSKAARMAPSNLRNGGQVQGAAQNPYELNYDDEPMDEADELAASHHNNSSRNLHLPNRQRAEGRLSFHDEGDSHTFAEPKHRRGRAFVRDKSESLEAIKSRKATGRLSFNDYDEGEVEMVEFSSASKDRKKKVSHFVESNDGEMIPRQSKELLSSKLLSLQPQRQNPCDQTAKKPANRKTNSNAPAPQDQKTSGNRPGQVVEKSPVFVLGSRTNGSRPQPQDLIDGELAPAKHSKTPRHFSVGTISLQSPNQGIHPERLNYIKSQSPQVDPHVEAPGPIWNPDGTYNHVRNPDPKYGDRVEDWIYNVVNEFLGEKNITMPEPPVAKVDAKTPVKKTQVLAQSPGWMKNKIKKAPSTMKNDLLAAISRSLAEPIITANREKPPAAAVAEPKKNPNMAKALDILGGSRNPNNRKNKARQTAIDMWDESDCAKPAVDAEAVQGHNEDVSMTGMDTPSAGPTNATFVLQSIEEISELDCNMVDLNPLTAGTSGNATENSAEKAADESVTMGSIEDMSQLSLSLSPPTMRNASPAI